MEKKYYILTKNNKQVIAANREKFENPIRNLSSLIEYHPTEKFGIKRIPIAYYGQKEWFRTKKVAIAYCQFLIEKRALELARRADILRNTKVALIDTENGTRTIY